MDDLGILGARWIQLGFAGFCFVYLLKDIWRDKKNLEAIEKKAKAETDLAISLTKLADSIGEMSETIKVLKTMIKEDVAEVNSNILYIRDVLNKKPCIAKGEG